MLSFVTVSKMTIDGAGKYCGSEKFVNACEWLEPGFKITVSRFLFCIIS